MKTKAGLAGFNGLSKVFIGAVLVSGTVVLGEAMLLRGFSHQAWFIYIGVMAVVASRFKVSLPGLNGNMSVNLPFILLAVAVLSFSEAVTVAALSTLVQCLPRAGKRSTAVQVAFNMCNMMNAVALGFLGVGLLTRTNLHEKAVILGVTGAIFFLAQTVPVATVISLTEHLKVQRVWREVASLTLPYFVLSAGVAAISLMAMHTTRPSAGDYLHWSIPALAMTLMYFTYRSFHLYFRPVAEAEVKPAQAMTAMAGR